MRWINNRKRQPHTYTCTHIFSRIPSVCVSRLGWDQSQLTHFSNSSVHTFTLRDRATLYPNGKVYNAQTPLQGAKCPSPPSLIYYARVEYGSTNLLHTISKDFHGTRMLRLDTYTFAHTMLLLSHSLRHMNFCFNSRHVCHTLLTHTHIAKSKWKSEETKNVKRGKVQCMHFARTR